MILNKSLSRRQRDLRSSRFAYDTLEPKHLLAVAIGTEPVKNLDTAPLAEANLRATIDFSPTSDLITQLATPIPMQDQVEYLRDHLAMGQFDSMTLTSSSLDQLGFQHLKYQQHHRGFIVQGGEYTVHLKDNQVVSVSGNFVDIDTPALEINLSEAQALESALEFIGADAYVWELGENDALHGFHAESDSNRGQPAGELVYSVDREQVSTLTFKFDIYAAEPHSRNYVFVDVKTGDVVEVQNRIHESDVAANGTSLYNGTVDFTGDSFTGGFRLRQAADGVETYDLNNSTTYSDATDVVSSSTSFTASDVQTGVQAHYGAEQTLQYFMDQHSRDSYDNAGSILASYVSYSTNYANAFWNGSVMTYGDGNSSWNPLVSLDIVGHEVSHGVTEFSAGLVYSYESGALNESFSDIFGEAIENFATGSNDWLMGEDIGVNAGSALRSLADPPLKGDPDTYLGNNWNFGSSDNGGVHTNSGVQNKWFYLLTVGEAGVNDNGDAYDVTGIGILDAEAIAYRNLSVYLTSSSDYFDARDGGIQSAIDLFGENSQQHLSTIAAWDAVGVGHFGSFVDLNLNAAGTQGSSIYQATVSEDIPGDVIDTISIDLDPNQALSITISGTDGLVPAVEIYDPSDNLITSGVATGSNLTFQNVAVSSAGTYQIIVSGDAGTIGNYDMDVLLNASLEGESNGETQNDTLGDAQSIDASAMVVGSDATIDRLALAGELERSGNLVAGDDFESGSLDGAWTTSSSHSDGRIVVSNSLGADGSSHSLLMDIEVSGNYNLNEAIWTVDLTGLTNPELGFFHAEWNDETDALPASFTGSVNGDGVAISADGTIWHTVLTDTDQFAGIWDFVSIDLADAAATAGISLGANFKIKFQQYDNFPYDTDGRAYDEIGITTPQASADWYAFELAAGQSATATVSGVSDSLTVDLYDASGSLVAGGAAGTNVTAYVSQFVNNGAAATFYAAVTGFDAVEYDLVVTRGADFDLEPNTTAPQDLSGLGGVFGFVSSTLDSFAEPDAAAASTVIDTFFNEVTLSNNVDNGSIYAASAGYGAPTGSNVFAPGATAANGFREGDDELRADFAQLQSSVSIDVGSDDAADIAWLRAYDSNDTLIAQATSGSISTGNHETITVSSSSTNIAYIIAAGLGGDITPLDNLLFQTFDPNDDIYTISAVANDQFSFEAFLPGLGPNQFNNRLDNGSGSELRMELRDPNGALIGTNSQILSHTVALTGDYELRVFSETTSGEYFIEQWYNHAPDASVDFATLNEDAMTNIAVMLNDGDVDGDTFSVTSVTTPGNGVAVLKEDGTVDYTPADDYFGSDSFSYVLMDEHGAMRVGTVNVTVDPVNDAPTDIALSANLIAENTDTSGGAVDIGTLSASDLDSTYFTYGLVSGAGGTDNGSFEIDGSTLRVKQGVDLDFEAKPQYSVRVEVSDGELTFEKQFLINVENQIEVSSIVVRDSSNNLDQRSSVNQLVVTFDELVDIGADAFSVIQRSNVVYVTGTVVDISYTSSDATGVTVATITFNDTTRPSFNGDLYDGNYQLTIDHTKITRTGSSLAMATDFVFGDSEDDDFFALYGDWNGDRVINDIDIARFRVAYGHLAGSADYQSAFDYDGDGDIDPDDRHQLRKNTRVELPFM